MTSMVLDPGAGAGAWLQPAVSRAARSMAGTPSVSHCLPCRRVAAIAELGPPAFCGLGTVRLRGTKETLITVLRYHKRVRGGPAAPWRQGVLSPSCLRGLTGQSVILPWPA